MSGFNHSLRAARARMRRRNEASRVRHEEFEEGQHPRDVRVVFDRETGRGEIPPNLRHYLEPEKT